MGRKPGFKPKGKSFLRTGIWVLSMDHGGFGGGGMLAGFEAGMGE